jgi:Leucine-rich repeat (LRR) protein
MPTLVIVSTCCSVGVYAGLSSSCDEQSVRFSPRSHWETGAAERVAPVQQSAHFAPPSLGNLRRLTILDLRNNRLTTLPTSLRDLDNLTSLDLRANRFVSLSPSIGELPKLEKLDLRWNKISPSPGSLQPLEQRGCVIYL